MSEQAEQGMARVASAWIEGCGIEVSFIWGSICLLFIGGWHWHTGCRTPGAATTATAGERTPDDTASDEAAVETVNARMACSRELLSRRTRVA